MKSDERILILDFGSQYTQLIARCVREFGVYCEIHPFSIDARAIDQFKPKGIILSGGPETVRNAATPRIPSRVFELGCPLLGICYGMQSMAVQLGGTVSVSTKREFGSATVCLSEPSLLLSDIHDRVMDDGTLLLDVWMSHGDQVLSLPPHFVTIARTENCPIAGMANQQKKWYGVQFHPETAHTPQGKQILKRFVFECCACIPCWTMSNIIDEKIQYIRKQVGKEHVLLALSGGVDSSVTALLLHRALGDQLNCIFVDTGLLRSSEAEHVQHRFSKHFGLRLICIDAQDLFYHALRGESDPEKKRQIIGKQFIDVFAKEALKMPQVAWLAQGTIYSDVIESAATETASGHVIKSHHNVGGLPQHLPFKLLEPLRELFKDEVCRMGTALGLSNELRFQHPFPGPGLAVRVLGEVRRDDVHTLRLADAILIEELKRAKLYETVSQAFAVFLPVKSVGVLGDARHYDHVIAIRVVHSTDFMTASWARLPYDFLEIISNRIINEVPGISRVTYDISNKPPATIEWE